MFTENPLKEPKPVLSENDSLLTETQLVEVYSGVKLRHGDNLTLGIWSPGRDHGHQLMTFTKNTSDTSQQKNFQKTVKMNIFDLGGHSEYYSCSGLFIAASGIFLVCVDSSDFKTQSFHEEYYCRIGCYIDFISQITFEHKESSLTSIFSKFC